MPSWGLFARHVKNLAVNHVEFRAALLDLRPVVRLDDVAGATFDAVRFPAVADTPVFVLNDVSDLAVHDSPGLPETSLAGRTHAGSL
jgi:hypothetical protein